MLRGLDVIQRTLDSVRYGYEIEQKSRLMIVIGETYSLVL